jgi:hypothetical protein
MTENCKLRKAILSAFYNFLQRNFGILLIVWCSFKLWWNFCLDLLSSKFWLIGEWSIASNISYKLFKTWNFCMQNSYCDRRNFDSVNQTLHIWTQWPCQSFLAIADKTRLSVYAYFLILFYFIIFYSIPLYPIAFYSMLLCGTIHSLSLGYLRSHDCNFRSPLMKTLDWSVETLGLDYNSTGLCNHLFKPE